MRKYRSAADVFDALTFGRCYKNSMLLEKAYAIIREGSCTRFDPETVEAFFAATEDIKKMLKTEAV